MKRQLILFTFTLIMVITLCGAVNAADNDTNDTDQLTSNTTENPDPPLTITKGSWDTAGLDSNNVNVGPNQTLIQFHVTNPDPVNTATDVEATLSWTSSNTYINLASGETYTKNLGDIAPGETKDVFFLVEITRNSLAYDTSRNYQITIAGTNTPTYTPTGSILVKKLLSQNRNDITGITVSDNSPQVGDIITVTVFSTTAASNYPELNLPLVDYNTVMLLPLEMETTWTDTNGITQTTNSIYIPNPNGNNFKSVWTFLVQAAGNSDIYPVIYDRSGNSYHYNADYGEMIHVCVPATIGNLVWNDLNANGMYDTGEPGLANIMVTLYDSTGTPLVSKVTDADGYYSFTDIPPGSYYVNFTTPSGYYISPYYGTLFDNKANPATGNTAIFSMSCGETDNTQDAGMYRYATVGDFVWDDQNANGIYDGNGYGISGVTVTLYHADDTVAATTTTDSNGYYLFNEVIPGEYYVGFTIPAGYIVSPIVAGNQTNKADASGFTETFSVYSGQSSLVWDAGMYQLGSIGDFVWNDLNADGVWQTGEPGLDNVTVELYNSITDLLVDSTSTDTAGYYLFSGLTPGSYYVKFYQPDMTWNFSPAFQSGLIYSTANPTTGETPTLTLTSGQNQLQWDAALYQNANIGDFVFYDANLNGMYQPPDDYGLSGIMVKLYDSIGTLLQTTSTDSSGYYNFSVIPGSYYLEFILPTGYQFSDYYGAGFDNQANPATGLTTTTTVTSGETQDYWDAGMRGIPVATATVGDYVWDDQNADGIYQGNGYGIAGVTVTLYHADDTVAATTTTDSDGYYLFTDLEPGNYYIHFTIPSGYIVSPIVAGDQTNKADSNGYTATFTLAEGQTDLTWDAGMYQLGSIGDFVWDDLNADGVWQTGEPGLDNVTVELYNSITDLLVDSTSTDTAGYYLFSGLTPGSYYVKFYQPDMTWNFSPAFQSGLIYSTANPTTGETPTLTLTSGQNQLQWDAALYQNANIGDYVWNDLNNNGQIDTGEPGLHCVIVNLYGSNGDQLNSTCTDIDGYYSFSVIPGEYYLEFIKPTGFQISSNWGAGYDNQANPTTGLTSNTTVTSGETQDYWDAGMWMPASIGNFVWNDQNANGIFNGIGTGLPDVRVELYDDQGGYYGYTITDANGFYIFNDLLPGTYILKFELLSGFKFSPVIPGDITNKVHPDGYTDPVTLQAGENNPYIDAGMFEPVTIGSYVWNDLNRNGIRDAGEPGISHVDVELYNGLTNTLVSTTTTDASGNYLFSDEDPGFYYVKFIRPDGYTFTLQNVGNDPSINSSAFPANGETATREYTSGTIYLNVNAGLYQEAADLVITKNVEPKEVYVGDNITYTITVTNLGPDTAENVRVTDTLPAGITYLNHETTTGNYDVNTGIWTIGDLEKDQTATLTITAKTTQTGVFTNTAVVESDTYDPNPENTATATITVKPRNPTPLPVNGETVPMQPTGVPLGSMILGLLTVLGGIVLAKK